jgi:hypothetical protein
MDPPPHHLPLARFLTYRHPFPTSRHKFTWTTNTYATCYPFAHGLFITLMMEAVRTSEKSVNFNVTTRHYISGDSKLPTHHCENLKSHSKQNSVSTSCVQTVLNLENVPVYTPLSLGSPSPCQCSTGYNPAIHGKFVSLLAAVV